MRYQRLATLVLALGLQGPAHALGSLAEVTIVDRDSGRAIPAHYYHGEYWVAGTPGARYAIAVRNRADERLLAVTSVDGVNVVSGETASYAQSGYVFAPREGYRIDGWRKSDAEVAAFVFTESADAYATRTGRPANVGVIGIALFREAARDIRPAVTLAPGPAMPEAPKAGPPPMAAPAPQRAARAMPRGEAQGAADAAAQSLGTGHGARETSFAAETTFERREAQPDEIIRIRYDSLRNLVAMGVVPAPRRPWTAPQPFPGEPRYVPDPPG